MTAKQSTEAAAAASTSQKSPLPTTSLFSTTLRSIETSIPQSISSMTFEIAINFQARNITNVDSASKNTTYPKKLNCHHSKHTRSTGRSGYRAGMTWARSMTRQSRIIPSLPYLIDCSRSHVTPDARTRALSTHPKMMITPGKNSIKSTTQNPKSLLLETNAPPCHACHDRSID